MNVTAEDLVSMVGSIWQSMLGLTPVPSDPASDVPADGQALAASIEVSGPWSGSVVFQLPVEMARQAGGAMFGMEAAEVGDPEMRDALGELTNVFAGNFKAKLPNGCLITTPKVIEAQGAAPTTKEGRQIGAQSFALDGQVFTLAIFER